MRKLIAGMKISFDGKVEGLDGMADWVEGWWEAYGLTAQIDACVLGAGMYPGYEAYWGAINDAPNKPHPMTGNVPVAADVAWDRFANSPWRPIVSRGLAPAIVGLVWASVLTIARGAPTGIVPYAVTAAVALLTLRTKLSAPVLILLSGIVDGSE